MSNRVWDAEHGWHDGPDARLSVDDSGRIHAEHDPRALIGTDSTDPRVGTTFDHRGYSVRVDVQPDEDSRPDEADTLGATVLDYWQRDLWQYVGVVVTVSRVGVELGSASLWGIESGTFPVVDDDGELLGERYVGPYTEAVDDLISEAVAEADATAERLARDVQGTHWTVQFQPIARVVRVVRECEAAELTTTYVGPFASEDEASAYAERVEAASYGERDVFGHVVVTSAYVERVSEPTS